MVLFALVAMAMANDVHGWDLACSILVGMRHWCPALLKRCHSWLFIDLYRCEAGQMASSPRLTNLGYHTTNDHSSFSKCANRAN